MRIVKSYDRKFAKKVLKCLTDYVSLLSGPDLMADIYDNGREHGYAIRNSDKVIVFSEYRNSDEHVLYKGDALDWCTTHKLTADMYAKKTFYKEADIYNVVSDGMVYLFGKKKGAN